jgi:UDP-N-acetylmuramoylalanine--D-glutamate ligase
MKRVMCGPNECTGRGPQRRMEKSFSGKKVVVVGMGVSGVAVARFLRQAGASVTVSELRRRGEIDLNLLNTLTDMGVEIETGGHQKETFEKAQMIVLSPGVPHDSEFLRSVRREGIHVTGEFELASRLIGTPVIAVTGTNGKSTVTAFIGSMLEQAGHRVFVGGNFGTPLMEYAAGAQEADYVVAEVSSFQLDTTETFSPAVSVLLNITPDHLDRYENFEAYARSKLRILENQGPGQVAVINDDDDRLSLLRSTSGGIFLRYGLRETPERNAFLREGRVRTRLKGGDGPSFSIDSFLLPGTHNLENLLGGILVGLSLSVPPSAIQECIRTFRGLPNRMEWVGGWKEVDFYNDSKATNVDSAVRAVTSFHRPLILIAGGRHKGADYLPLVKAAEGRVKRAFFMGEAKELLAGSFQGKIPFSLVKDMGEAVSRAFSGAERGDVVLLAPGCSSFDMYTDYAHRGSIFKETVKRLIQGRI